MAKKKKGSESRDADVPLTPEATAAPATATQVAFLSAQIEALDDAKSDFGDIAEMSPEQIEDVARVIKGGSEEALLLRRQRKAVRYDLYRLRTEAEGKCSAFHVSPEFRSRFESQPAFKGWRFFGTLWDVSLMDPFLAIARDQSEQEDWDAIIRAKFPQITLTGGVVYPDIAVKKRVDATAGKLIADNLRADKPPGSGS